MGSPLNRKEWVAAGVALLAGLGLYFEIRSWVSPKPAIEDPRFLRAARALPAGHPVGLRDFTAPAAAVTEPAPSSAYTDQDWHRIEGRLLQSALEEGAYLTEANLAPKNPSLGLKVPRGYRAYAIEAEGAERVQGGDRVDLLVTHDGRGAGEAVTLVEAAIVMARPRRDSREVILLLTPRQIQLLEKKRRNGKLTLALRNPEDLPTDSPGEARVPRRKRARSGRIEVWSEAE